MNTPLQDRLTWIHFQLRKPVPVIKLAQIVETEILASGFARACNPGFGEGASSTLVNGQSGGSGENILDVIPTGGIMLSAASVRFGKFDCGLEIVFRIGEVDDPPFDATTIWDHFTLRVNYMMDRNRLRWFADSNAKNEELQSWLNAPRIAYCLIKHLFRALDAERCIGIDDKYLTGDYFNDPPGFFSPARSRGY